MHQSSTQSAIQETEKRLEAISTEHCRERIQFLNESPDEAFLIGHGTRYDYQKYIQDKMQEELKTC